MLNHVVIMGRLVADPELRTTPNGVPVATLRLAVDRDFKNKQTGERETDFINVVAWRQTAEFVNRFFNKGRMAVVEGRLQIRQFTDKENNKRSVAEVVAENIYFGDSPRREGEGAYSRPAGGAYGASHLNQGGYGVPAPSGYGASMQSGYGTPAPSGYGTPMPSSYGAPSGGGYASPETNYPAPAHDAYAPPSGGDQFSELSDEDSELPF